ncbi:MAG: marine proteobacterial sortase target protein [Xanthomonadales bacterium]|nr:marine proteobacterial sortase target protein [Xanthomonadales bacterium]
MSRPASIRDRLETDAWRNHPAFARRQAAKRDPARRSLKWQDRALLILSALLLLLLIVRVETAQAAGEAPFWGLELLNGERAERTVALDTDIDVEITGLTARVDVRQSFRNDGGAWAEAVYRFPLPPGAAVDRLRIEAGARVIEGEIQEKTEARRTYQKARDSGKLSSLVEQQRANQFETRLANIAPGEDIAVFISFQVRVDFRDGEFGLRMPLTFTPRWDAPGSRDPVPQFVSLGSAGRPGDGGPDDHFLTIDVDLRTGLDLARLESRYHDVDIHPTLQGYRLFLADPDVRSDRAFELSWAPDFGTAPASSLMTWDGGEYVYALLMLSPPLAEAVEPQPREVVFVIDTSGSMEGASIRQARSALELGLKFLGPDDRFNLIEFDSDTRALFDESVPVRSPYLEEALDFIDDLRANGGTVMAPALARALDLPAQDGLLRQVIFVTDGSVGNEQELLLQVGDQLGDSRLFTVSIGSAPNAWFMRKAAEIGRGSHTHIGKLDEVAERMASLWTRIQHPALQDICVDWGTEAEFYPEIVPDLYAGEPLWLSARLTREPSEVLVCGELEGRYWETVARPKRAGGSAALAGLWARHKIEALEDSRIFGVDADEVQRGVTELGLDFGLLTPYTSLVAVDRTPVRPQSAGLSTRDVPNLLPAGTTLAAGFSQTATGWPAQLALSLFSLLVATGMLLYLPPSRPRPSGGARSPMAASSE